MTDVSKTPPKAPYVTNPLWPREKQFSFPAGTTFSFNYEWINERSTGEYIITANNPKGNYGPGGDFSGFFEISFNPRTGEIKISDKENLPDGTKVAKIIGDDTQFVNLPHGGSIIGGPIYDYPEKRRTFRPEDKDYPIWLGFIKKIAGDPKCHYRYLDSLRPNSSEESRDHILKLHDDQKRITKRIIDFKPPKPKK